MDFKDRISKIIEYAQLSASEFADTVDVPRSSISHIASGRNKPSLDFLIKIKNRFPELQWDWLINGEGEMKEIITENDEEPVKPAPTSLPDLFSIIDDENFGKTESEDRIQKEIPRESVKTEQRPDQEILSDSPQLEKNTAQISPQTFENQENKIKRIVLFFENGKFESFEP